MKDPAIPQPVRGIAGTPAQPTKAPTEGQKESERTMKNEFGSVEYKGKKYQLTNQAVADNYGTEGAVRYYANAIDAGGNSHRVAWDTKEEWDLSQERETLQRDSFLSNEEEKRLAELEEMVLPDVSDESNACNWESPISVTSQ